MTGKLDSDRGDGCGLRRALAALDLLDESPDGTSSTTDAGTVLIEDHPRSQRDAARLEEGPDHYTLWGYLPESVRSGGRGTKVEVTGVSASSGSRGTTNTRRSSAQRSG